MNPENQNTLYPVVYARAYDLEKDSNRKYYDSISGKDLNTYMNKDEHPNWLHYYDVDFTKPVMVGDDQYKTMSKTGFDIYFPDGKIQLIRPTLTPQPVTKLDEVVITGKRPDPVDDPIRNGIFE